MLLRLQQNRIDKTIFDFYLLQLFLMLKKIKASVYKNQHKSLLLIS